MNDNYAVINGKKIELTEKQIKALGFEIRKNPFERSAKDEEYYCIKETGEIYSYYDNSSFDDWIYNNANYFNDENFARQVALHQLLYRKLLKFAYENESEDVEWNNRNGHWHIYYDTANNKFYIEANDAFKHQGVYFSTRQCAERAIEEAIKPFIKEHPEFVW